MERRVAVRGIAYHDKKLLAVLHRDAAGKPVNFWAIPGGGLDPGEGLVDGLSRELVEETGIAPRIGKLLFVQQFHGTNKKGAPREELEFFFEIENIADYATVDLHATTHGEAELAAINWITPRAENILPAFLQDYDIAAHLIEKKPVYFYTDLNSTSPS